MNILDLFSGIGGFHKGLLQAGAQIDWCGFSEIDKYATSVYKKHFPESEELGNVRTIDVSSLPSIDILCGGFPCQAFSIAGKRKGFEDTRGTLFFEIARICAEKRPQIIFLENVRGLLSHDSGATFETIIRTLGDLGYCVQWQVCNSRYFGVPQNRERVFIIGHYGKGSFRQIFPIRENGGKNNEPDRTQAVNSIDASYYKGVDNHGQRTMIEITKDMPDAQRVYDPNGIAKTLKGLGGGQGAKTGLYMVSDSGLHRQNQLRDIAPPLRANTGAGHDNKIIVHSTQLRSADRPSLQYSSGGSGPLSKDDVTVYCLDTGNTQAVEIIGSTQNNAAVMKDCSPALTSAMGMGGGQIPMIKGTRIRRLTPIECERLQGYPDNWTKYGCNGEDISDSQRYKMAGNSVTVNVIETISRRLITP